MSNVMTAMTTKISMSVKAFDLDMMMFPFEQGLFRADFQSVTDADRHPDRPS